jgi:hypothetical protein
MSRNGFQHFVNAQPAPGMPGDFAGANPRASMQASGTIQAAKGGLNVGRFAWLRDDTGTLQNWFSSFAPRLGFVRRENQALITDFLGLATEIVPEGFDAYAFTQGDFWATFTAGASVDQSVYANALDGTAVAGAANAATKVRNFTATVDAAGLMTVSNAGTGSPFAVGMVIDYPALSDDSGVPFYIVSLGTGSGGTGTYHLNKGIALTLTGADAYGLIATPFKVKTPVAVDAAFTAAIAATGVMTVSAVASGVLSVGQFISGAGVPANVQIVSQLSGSTGGVGTYEVNHLAAISSEAMTATAGKAAKISTWG